MPPPTFASDPPGTLTFTVRASTFEDLKRQIEHRIGAFWPSDEATMILGDDVEWDAHPAGPDANGLYTWAVDVRYRTHEVFSRRPT